MAVEKVNLRLIIDKEPDEDIEDEELDKLAQQLLEDLSELDLESPDWDITEQIPDDAKAVEPVTIGSLLIAAASGGVITSLINLLKDWLIRNERGSITIETKEGDKISITGITSEKILKVYDDWKKRHFPD